MAPKGGGDCKRGLDCAYNLLKNFAGKLVDKLTGGALGGADLATGRDLGTTRDAVANAVLNPPNLDATITTQAGPLAGSVGTNGINFTVSPSLDFAITADVTYTARDASKGGLSVGQLFGEGVVAGGTVNLDGKGHIVGGTASVGVGFSGPTIPPKIVGTVMGLIGINITSF